MPKTIFPAPDRAVPVLAAGGGLFSLINAFDWSATPLGPIAEWPVAIRVTVRLMIASAVPMCLLAGRDGVMIYNDAYAPIAGARHPYCLGSSVFESWPEVAEFNRDIMDRVYQGESPSFEDQHFVLARNGHPEDVWLDLDYSPLPGDDGRALGAIAILSETTKRVSAEQRLADSEERLALALAASGVIGTWDWRLGENIVVADARFAEMYGVDPQVAAAGAPIELFIDGVHPDDRAYVEAKIDQALRERIEYRAEYRLSRGSGPARWILALGKVIVDAAERPTRLPGVVIDITDRKAAEAALASSEAGFRTLANSMPQMVWSTRPDGFHDYYNDRWYEYTGMPAGSTDGEGWNGMFHADDQERAWQRWRNSLATGEPYEIEYRLRRHDGAYRWTLGRALPVRDAEGRITRWFGTCTDIHEAKIAAEEREIVAQELSHRIKNIFSVLNGIIGLAARTYPETKAFAEQLRQRIMALGQAHDFVRPHSRRSRPEPVETSLFGLLEQLLSPYRTDAKHRIGFAGDDVAIDDAAATPLALLFHELATNAAKYGALAAPEGSISLTGQAGEQDYRLLWKESGASNLSKPEREGFGSRLVMLSLQGQLGGRFERFWDEDGLRIEIEIPLTALQRSTSLARR